MSDFIWRGLFSSFFFFFSCALSFARSYYSLKRSLERMGIWHETNQTNKDHKNKTLPCELMFYGLRHIIMICIWKTRKKMKKKKKKKEPKMEQSIANEMELNKISEFNTQIRLSYCLYDTYIWCMMFTEKSDVKFNWMK